MRKQLVQQRAPLHTQIGSGSRSDAAAASMYCCMQVQTGTGAAQLAQHQRIAPYRYQQDRNSTASAASALLHAGTGRLRAAAPGRGWPGRRPPAGAPPSPEAASGLPLQARSTQNTLIRCVCRGVCLAGQREQACLNTRAMQAAAAEPVACCWTRPTCERHGGSAQQGQQLGGWHARHAQQVSQQQQHGLRAVQQQAHGGRHPAYSGRRQGGLGVVCGSGGGAVGVQLACHLLHSPAPTNSDPPPLPQQPLT